MLIAERRRRILEHVRLRGYASFRDLADVVGISESTVRRDLRAMVADGLLTATRGGAGPARRRASADPQLRPSRRAADRDDPVAAARAAIAVAAAALVEPGTAVLLGPGPLDAGTGQAASPRSSRSRWSRTRSRSPTCCSTRTRST